MKQRLLCKLFGFHKHNVLKEEDIKDKRGVIIGEVIVSRCDICGNIKQNKFYIEHGYD